MNFTFLEVTSSDMLEKVFAFRYKIFVEMFPKYLQMHPLTDEKEHDKYDPYAVHFVALDEGGEVCATVRFIHNSPIGYPTENDMTFNNKKFERDKLGEMSRIFIDAKYRNIKTTKIIMQEVKKFMYYKMTNLGIEYTYGALEKNFIRLLKIYKISYCTLTDEQQHKYLGLRYPCILYTEQLGIDNPELIINMDNKYVK
ncbi:MAG: GNAT family N-acetyltransferase [Sulfurimonas sp.]|nr:GNAT family N-acetyltransferase [Sulfurimonas sp.]